MSLKAVHLVFILVCTLLAAWVAVWCMQQFQSGGGMEMLVGAICSALVGAGLVWYAIRFVQKFRSVRYY